MKHYENKGRQRIAARIAAYARLCVAAIVGIGVNAHASDATAFNDRIDKLVAAAIARQDAAPPASGPVPAKNRNIVVIPCAMSAEGCARLARGAIEAAQAIGWKTTLIDPVGDTGKMAQAVEKAISMKADGIVLTSIDASLIAGPLREAKRAGIPVVADGTNQDGLYDDVIFSHDFYFRQGYLVAAAAYVFGGHKLHTIMLTDNEFGGVRTRAEGSNAFLADCEKAGGDCKLSASQNMLVSGLTTVVPQQAVNLVRLHPDYTALWTGYDAALNFIIQGLRQADLDRQGFAVGFDANVANLAVVKAGGYERATLGAPLEWGGYALIDSMNRLFAHSAPVDEGLRSRLLTKDNLPAATAWEGDVDFRSKYRMLWGRK